MGQLKPRHKRPRATSTSAMTTSRRSQVFLERLALRRGESRSIHTKLSRKLSITSPLAAVPSR